jgi:hypothetical protein
MNEQTQGQPTDRRDPELPTVRDASGYPLGRGYGHDLMRGGEVFGGYGYSDRPEYTQTRGERKRGG